MAWQDLYETLLALDHETRRAQLEAAEEPMALSGFDCVAGYMSDAQRKIQSAMNVLLDEVQAEAKKQREIGRSLLDMAARANAVAEQVAEIAEEGMHTSKILTSLSLLHTQVPPLPEAPPMPEPRKRGRPRKVVALDLESQIPVALPMPIELQEQPMVGEEISEFLASGSGTAEDESTDTYDPAPLDDQVDIHHEPPAPAAPHTADLADLRF